MTSMVTLTRMEIGWMKVVVHARGFVRNAQLDTILIEEISARKFLKAVLKSTPRLEGVSSVFLATN